MGVAGSLLSLLRLLCMRCSQGEVWWEGGWDAAAYTVVATAFAVGAVYE